jgi:signal transduction histidine kinase
MARRERTAWVARRLGPRLAPWNLCLAAGIAGTGVFYLLDSPWQLVWGNLVAGGAVLAIVAGLWWRRPLPALPWLLLLAGVLCFAGGDVVWTVYEQVALIDPFPSAADVIYLAGYPLLAAALLLLIRGRSPRGDWTSLIDATVIAVGTSLLVWVFLVEPYVRDQSLSLVERVVSIAYPAGDVLLIALAARFAVTPGRRTTAFRALLAALILLLSADTLFAVLNLFWDYEGVSPADGGYLMADVLFAVAVLHPTMHILSLPARRSSQRLSRRRLAALAGASLMAPAVLVVQRLTGTAVEPLVIAASAAVLFLLVVTRMAGLIRLIEQAQAERGRLLDRTVQAAEQERIRLAAELHDGPIQHLSMLAYELERARLRLEAGRLDGSASSVRQTQERLQHEVGELRRLMVGLRPPVLDEVGLEAALRDQVANFERRTQIACKVEVALAERLDPELETVLYRVTQEALTNVEKHSRAGQLGVVLFGGREAARLEVRDDGVGFDPTATADLARRGHFGLLGMRERVELAGGAWSVDTRPGGGVAVRATFVRPTVPRPAVDRGTSVTMASRT